MQLRARLRPGLSSRGVTLEVTVALVGCVLSGVGATAATRSRPAEAALLLGAVVLGVLLVAFRRRRPLLPFLVSAALAACSTDVNAGLVLTAYAVARYRGRWPERLLAAVVGVVAACRPWSGGPLDELAPQLTSGLLIVLLPGAIGGYARTRALLLSAVRERAERAEAERELLARDAVLVERARIAREMHDAVGHRVSLMVLQAGAIEMAAADRATVEQLSGQVQVAGRQALDELRQMVGVLRTGDPDGAAPLGPQPGLAELPQLVDQSVAAGLPVTLHGLPDDAPPVDAPVGRAAYRIVQEAVTNAAKHAPGAAVTVTLDRAPDQLLVRVVNGPAARPVTAVTGGGFGLVGLAERVRTLGGRLRAERSDDGGFEVEAVVPG